MRIYQIVLIAAFFGFASCKNNDLDQIKSVVYKWNEIHNTHNTKELRSMYAPDVLFYGRQTSADSCFIKKAWLMKPAFRQDIITPIQTTFYSSGIVKCDFTKMISPKSRTTQYSSYLLLKKVGDRYLICGESDLVSDHNRHVQLNLGNEVVPDSNNWAMYLGVTILAVCLIVLFMRMKAKGKFSSSQTPVLSKLSVQPENNLSPGPIVTPDSDLEERLVKKITAALAENAKTLPANEITEQEKGFAFEKFVVDRFNKTYFKMLEWRGDKYHNGIYPVSSRLPDLVYHFKTSRFDAKLAVECKWRAEFKSNKIHWTTEEKLKIYRDYQSIEKVKVFVAIGLGGVPKKPAFLFIIPLSSIQSTYLHENDLKNFSLDPAKEFFLDGDKGIFIDR